MLHAIARYIHRVPLHPDAHVVRGGTIRSAAVLLEKVREAIEDGDGPVVSVFCDVDRSDDSAGLTLTELSTESDIPHSKLQVSTVGRLSAGGFALTLDVSNGQPRTHHHVTIGEPVEESTLVRFIECFDEPILNPTGGKVRR